MYMKKKKVAGKRMKIFKSGRQGLSLSPILFNLYSEYLSKEDLDVFGDFKIRGQKTHTVKHEDKLGPPAQEETVILKLKDDVELKLIWYNLKC
jgi:hypothetical protein